MPLNLLITDRGIVVGHDAMRTNRDEVSAAQRAIWPLSEMALRDFFNDGLGHELTPVLPSKTRFGPFDFAQGRRAGARPCSVIS